MLNLLILGLVLARVGQAASVPEKKDLDAFQGQWKVLWVEGEGQKIERRTAIFTLRGKKLLIDDHEDASLEIDPTCSPATMFRAVRGSGHIRILLMRVNRNQPAEKE